METFTNYFTFAMPYVPEIRFLFLLDYFYHKVIQTHYSSTSAAQLIFYIAVFVQVAGAGDV